MPAARSVRAIARPMLPAPTTSARVPAIFSVSRCDHVRSRCNATVRRKSLANARIMPSVYSAIAWSNTPRTLVRTTSPLDEGGEQGRVHPGATPLDPSQPVRAIEGAGHVGGGEVPPEQHLGARQRLAQCAEAARTTEHRIVRERVEAGHLAGGFDPLDDYSGSFAHRVRPGLICSRRRPRFDVMGSFSGRAVVAPVRGYSRSASLVRLSCPSRPHLFTAPPAVRRHGFFQR